MVAPPILYICFSHNHPRVGHPQPCLGPGAHSIFYSSFAGAPVGVYRIALLRPSCLSYHTRTVLLYVTMHLSIPYQILRQQLSSLNANNILKVKGLFRCSTFLFLPNTLVAISLRTASKYPGRVTHTVVL